MGLLLAPSRPATMKIQFAFVLSTLVVVSSLGCGGHASSGTESSGAGGAASSSSSGSIGGSSIGGSSTRPITTTSCEPTGVDAGQPPEVDANVPLNHRPSACCSSQRGAGPGSQPYSQDTAARDLDGAVACLSDSECDSGTNGRCFPFEGLVGPGGCSYDECSSDSDCPAGTACVCRSSLSDSAANVCAPAGNCAVDSDCGPAGYCSPSRANCSYPSPYFCHTALDTCVNDADCASLDAGAPSFASAVCSYDEQARHWACSQLVCYPP
jgi:hypothetical protein